MLLGALESSEGAAELFGADAERLVQARCAVDEALGDAVGAIVARGAALSDIECVRYAVERIEHLIGGE